MTPDDITPGSSYAARFRIETFLDSKGQPVDTTTLAPGERVVDAQPGVYESIGVIEIRDTQNRRLKLKDTQCARTWIVGYDQVWDIDTVEWQDADQ